MTVAGIDSSILIASFNTFHAMHDEALGALKTALEGEAVVPIRSLVESYSVLTRMPPPHRMRAGIVRRLLQENLQGRARIVEFPSKGCWSFLASLAEGEILGGAVYDAEIVAAARKAGATQIWTLNRRDFERLVSEGMEVLSPL